MTTHFSVKFLYFSAVFNIWYEHIFIPVCKNVTIHPCTFLSSGEVALLQVKGSCITFLKHLGFLLFSITNKDSACSPVAFAQTIAVICFLLTLKPEETFSWRKAKDFPGRAFQFIPVLSQLYTSSLAKPLFFTKYKNVILKDSATKRAEDKLSYCTSSSLIPCLALKFFNQSASFEISRTT